MSRNNLFRVGLIPCLLMFVSGLTMAASAPSPTALQDPNVEAAVEGTANKIRIIEATRSKAKAADSTESVDCFYEANKYHADCHNTRAKTR